MSFLNQRFIITTLVYILLIALGIVFVLRPLVQRVQTKQAELSEEYTNYQNAQFKFTQLSKLNGQKESIQNAKDISSKAIPATLDQDRFLLVVEQLAKDSNVTLVSLSIGENKATAQTTAKATVNSTSSSKTASTTTVAPSSTELAKINATLEINGQYNEILKFIDTVEHLERIIAVTTTTLTTADDNMVKASLNITAYGQSSTL